MMCLGKWKVQIVTQRIKQIVLADQALTYFSVQDGRPDRSFFSADCFHLSQRAQTLMARSLWNNMVSFAQEQAVMWSSHRIMSFKVYVTYILNILSHLLPAGTSWK